MPNDGFTQGICRNEVRVTLSRMKKGETTEMDGIPEDVKNMNFIWLHNKKYTIVVIVQR